MQTAILPDELVTPKPRLLSSLGNGETGYITFTEMRVMPDRSCFVNLDASLSEPGLLQVRVRKAEDGSYHVSVPADITYNPGEIKSSPGASLAPVASITIKPANVRWDKAGA
jgi:hypothetical protein